MFESNNFKEAVKVIKAGFREQGETILKDILQKEPNNEKVYLWLAAIAQTFEERIGYIRHLLAINPRNKQAQKAYRALLSEWEQQVKRQQHQLTSALTKQQEEQERLEIWEDKLIQWENSLISRHEKLDKQTSQVAEREQQLAEEEAQLQQRAKTVAEQETAMAQQRQQVADDEAVVQQYTQALDEQRAALQAAQKTLARQLQQAAKREQQLADDEAQLQQRAQAVAQEETALQTEQAVLAEQQQQVAEREQQLAKDEAVIQQYVQALDEQRATLQTAQQTLARQWQQAAILERQLNNEEATLQQRAQAVEQAETAMAQQRQQLAAEEIQLQQRVQAVAEQEAALQTERQEATAREARLQQRAQALDEQQEELDKQRADVEKQQATLQTERETLEQLWEEVEAKELQVVEEKSSQHDTEAASQVAEPTTTYTVDAPPEPEVPPSIPVPEAPPQPDEPYHHWNQAILEFLLDDLPRGSRVFLTIDDETLLDVATFLPEPPPRAERVTAFVEAVRTYCIRNGELLLGLVEPADPNDLQATPPYLAFLGAMVLAAYRMEGDDETSANNYYSRLNDVLGLPDTGRPDGLEGEAEFWEHWAAWLAQHGYKDSAKKGSGSYKYIRYPISQTLLRQSDKDALWNHFSKRKWSKGLSDLAVINRIHDEKQGLTKHIERALENCKDDEEYAEGFRQAIINEYNLWQQTDFQPQSNGGNSRRNVMRTISAGLYQTVDFFSGETRYWLHPRRRGHIRVDSLRVDYQGQEYTLNPSHAGWFEPLEIEVTPAMLTTGVTLDFVEQAELKQLKFPAQDFWLLVPDPEDPEMGTYATWSKPELGSPFLLLCKKVLRDELAYLKEEGLIEWQDEPTEFGEGWLEYQNMMVISQGWTGVSIQHEGLYSSLQPQSSLGVSLKGGIRVSQAREWLVGHGPAVMVRSFHQQAELELTSLDKETKPLFRETIKSGEVYEAIPWADYPAGSYMLTASAGTDEKRVLLQLVEWAALAMETPAESAPTTFENSSVFGAYITNTLNNDDDEGGQT